MLAGASTTLNLFKSSVSMTDGNTNESVLLENIHHLKMQWWLAIKVVCSEI